MKRKLVLAATMLVLALVAGSGYLALQGSASEEGPAIPGGIPLVRPAIAQQQGSFLDTEAGMSAYTNTSLTINLNNARNAFRTVERQTADWLIGSVPVPGYPEEEDPHCFVHRTGWIVCYYERGSPVGRVIHWSGLDTLGPTKLEQAVGAVAANAGVPVSSVGFFDFRYPNATEWLLIIDNDSFQVTIPSQFTVFERSFSSRGCLSLAIDGVSITGTCRVTGYGQISPASLSPDVSHNVSGGGAAISLLYLPPVAP